MGVQCTLESEQAVEQLKALVVSLTEQKEILAKECQELKRQREASSKESADYSTLLESQLETSNVSLLCRLQKTCKHRCRTVQFVTFRNPICPDRGCLFAVAQTSIIDAAETIERLQHQLKQMTHEREGLRLRQELTDQQLGALEQHVQALTAERNRKADEATGKLIVDAVI